MLPRAKGEALFAHQVVRCRRCSPSSKPRRQCIETDMGYSAFETSMRRLCALKAMLGRQHVLLLPRELCALLMSRLRLASIGTMPQQRRLRSMGSCASGGGHCHYSYPDVRDCDRSMPVDVFGLGCPPMTQALMCGILPLKTSKTQMRYRR